MTSASLLASPAEGHGLTSQLTDPIWQAMAIGKPTDTIVVVAVLKPQKIHQSETKQGRHRQVAFEVQRLEPILDRNQSDELRWLLQGLYEQRTSTGEQRMLDIGLGDTEARRLAVMERIEDWAAETDRTGGELESLWREKHGISPDGDWSWGDHGVPGDYRKASLAHLLGFGYDVGALKTDAPLPHETRDDEAVAVDGDDAEATG